MRLVDKAALYPARCMITGATEGPFVDLERENGDERLYVSLRVAESIGLAAGMGTRQAFDAMEEQLDSSEERVAELEQAELELKALRAAVRRTLYQGAVVYREDGQDNFKLRPVPGQKSPSVK
jgi:hypothetical protein